MQDSGKKQRDCVHCEDCLKINFHANSGLFYFHHPHGLLWLCQMIFEHQASDRNPKNTKLPNSPNNINWWFQLFHFSMQLVESSWHIFLSFLLCLGQKLTWAAVVYYRYQGKFCQSVDWLRTEFFLSQIKFSRPSCIKNPFLNSHHPQWIPETSFDR